MTRLTADALAAIRDRNSQVPWYRHSYVTQADQDRRDLLAEVDRLRAENAELDRRAAVPLTRDELVDQMAAFLAMHLGHGGAEFQDAHRIYRSDMGAVYDGVLADYLNPQEAR